MRKGVNSHKEESNDNEPGPGSTQLATCVWQVVKTTVINQPSHMTMASESMAKSL